MKNARQLKKAEKQKPTLTLLPGDKAGDINWLAKFYTKLTGKVMTPAELASAKARLDAPDEPVKG